LEKAGNKKLTEFDNSIRIVFTDGLETHFMMKNNIFNISNGWIGNHNLHNWNLALFEMLSKMGAFF